MWGRPGCEQHPGDAQLGGVRVRGGEQGQGADREGGQHPHQGGQGGWRPCGLQTGRFLENIIANNDPSLYLCFHHLKPPRVSTRWWRNALTAEMPTSYRSQTKIAIILRTTCWKFEAFECLLKDILRVTICARLDKLLEICLWKLLKFPRRCSFRRQSLWILNISVCCEFVVNSLKIHIESWKCLCCIERHLCINQISICLKTICCESFSLPITSIS